MKMYAINPTIVLQEPEIEIAVRNYMLSRFGVRPDHIKAVILELGSEGVRCAVDIQSDKSVVVEVANEIQS